MNGKNTFRTKAAEKMARHCGIIHLQLITAMLVFRITEQICDIAFIQQFYKPLINIQQLTI